MIDIDYELNNIIIKYNLHMHNKRFENYILAKQLINQLISHYLKSNKVLLVSTDETDFKFVRQDIKDDESVSIIQVNIDDKNNIEELSLVDDSFIIIISYKWYRELLNELYLRNISAIALYEYFTLNGLELDYEYYDIFGGMHHINSTGEKSSDFIHFNIYNTIFYDKKALKITDNMKLKEIYMQKIIFDYLYCRDFISVEEYIDQYISNKYTMYEDYKNAWYEINMLIYKIKHSISQRKNKDIIMFWLDALEYGEHKDMTFLNNIYKNTLIFENAYTVTPYTHSTIKTIFCSKKVVDDRSFKIPCVTAKNSPLISSLKEKDIRFKYYGYSNQFGKDLKSRYVITRSTPASKIYWNMLNDIINTKETTFNLLHEVYETHFPFVSGNIDTDRLIWKDAMLGDEPVSINDQQLMSRNYIDKQLEFYSSLLPKNAIKIYMSDHGHTKYGKFHTVLKVQHRKYKSKQYKELFSYIDFNRLIEKLIDYDNQSFSDLFRKYVQIQDIDYYFEKAIKAAIQKDAFDCDTLFGYRGVITSLHTYIRYNHGEEVYFNNENNSQKITLEMIDYLRELTGEYRINIKEEEKFKYTLYSYKVLENYMKRNSEFENNKKRIINDLFSKLDKKHNLAIRMGGEHTLKLFWALNWENKKKINYIIDTDVNCIASRLGIRVVHPSEINKYPIDTIVISSFKYRNEMKNELNINNDQYLVVDLYDYMEKSDVYCNKAFYLYEINKEDIDINFPVI